MKKFSLLMLLLVSITAQILHADYEFIFTKNSALTDEQWQRYLDGAIVAYAHSMGEEKTREIFPKIRAVGRDVMELRKDGEYFGHVCIVESKLEHETVYRLGMFGLTNARDLPEFSAQMMSVLSAKYQGHDFAAGCPIEVRATLGALILNVGFEMDSSVAADPAQMMALYGIDTSGDKYLWYRFRNQQ